MEQHAADDTAAILSVYVSHQCMPAILIRDGERACRGGIIDTNGTSHRLHRDRVFAFVIQFVHRNTVLLTVDLDVIRMLGCRITLRWRTHARHKQERSKQSAAETS